MAGDGQEWEEVIILQNQDGEPIAKKRMDVNEERGRKSESDVNGSRDAGSGALDRDVLSHLSIMSMKAGLSFSPHSDWTKVCKERTSPRPREDDEVEEEEEEEDDNPLNVVPADG